MYAEILQAVSFRQGFPSKPNVHLSSALCFLHAPNISLTSVDRHNKVSRGGGRGLQSVVLLCSYFRPSVSASSSGPKSLPQLPVFQHIVFLP